MNKKSLFFNFTRNNSLLLMFVFTTIFLIPLSPRFSQPFFYDVAYSFIFFTSIFALEYRRKILTRVAVSAFVLIWLARILGMPLLLWTSGIFTIVFFTFIVIRLVVQIARSQVVNMTVIFEAINGYLLIGIIFSLFVGLLLRVDPNAFVAMNVTGDVKINVIYYTLVTMTTLGYGDIVPVSPPAKSLAMLISISGQMYVAILIALLVGKYSASR